MSAPAWITQRHAISQTFVRGTRRESPGRAKAEQLDILAAIAARSVFDLPSAPESFEQDNITADVGRMANATIRTALCRLVRPSKKQPLYSVLLRISDEFAQCKLDLHPFDYAQLQPLVTAESTLFDQAFRHWVNKQKSPGSSYPDVITTENWLDFPVAERAVFVAALHRQDPPAAQSLLSEALPGESASVRGRLLAAIQPSVTQEDRAFLESLLSDRAKSVMELLTSMLGGIAGTEQYNARLEEAISRLSITKSGIKRKKSLLVEHPGHLKAYALDEWYSETFRHIDTDALARSLDIEASSFVDTISHPEMACLFVMDLARRGRHDLMLRLALRFPQELAKWIALNEIPELALLPDETKAILWKAILGSPDKQKFARWVARLEEVYINIRMPIPADASLALLDNKALQKSLLKLVNDPESTETGVVVKLVVMLHADSYEALQLMLDGVSPVFTTQANQLIKLLTLVEAEVTTESHTQASD